MSRKINEKEPNHRPSRPRRKRPPSNVPNLQGEEEEEEEEASSEASISAKKMRASSIDIIVNLSFCYRIEFVSVCCYI